MISLCCFLQFKFHLSFQTSFSLDFEDILNLVQVRSKVRLLSFLLQQIKMFLSWFSCLNAFSPIIVSNYFELPEPNHLNYPTLAYSLSFLFLLLWHFPSLFEPYGEFLSKSHLIFCKCTLFPIVLLLLFQNC